MSVIRGVISKLEKHYSFAKIIMNGFVSYQQHLKAGSNFRESDTNPLPTSSNEGLLSSTSKSIKNPLPVMAEFGLFNIQGRVSLVMGLNSENHAIYRSATIAKSQKPCIESAWPSAQFLIMLLPGQLL